MKRFLVILAGAMAAISVATITAHADIVRLEDLSLQEVHQDWGRPGVNTSVDGRSISIGGKVFEHGVGSHGLSTWWIDIDGDAQRFTGSVGVDDEVKGSADAANFPVEFRIYGDGRTLFCSGSMKAGDKAAPFDVDLTGIKRMALVIQPLGRGVDYAHGDWADAVITYHGDKPLSMEPPEEDAVILTPKPAAEPRIVGASVFGVRPGHPVLYTIAATGDRPMTFTADGLPQGITFDAATGRLGGSCTTRGEYTVNLQATNARGSTTRPLLLKVGDEIALTPPMGWNSWNCLAKQVSDENVRAAADAMVKTGLINHGWSYINIDDCWQLEATTPQADRRDVNGNVRTNERFPDMKSLVDYIHAQGLRAGIYSSPGPTTCGNFTGSYNFEPEDARQYAQWGFDYLKYDWCSYATIAKNLQRKKTGKPSLDILKKPYALMASHLNAQDRDIVYSLCQYGLGDVWEWGQEVGGNCWRTTNDISDNWSSMSMIGFNQYGREQYAGPGHWNDPDMLVVGMVGWGSTPRPTRLTPNEQYSHISLWCLQSAPLLIGCDMTQLDGFTLSLLTNDEVLAIDQDPLGRQAAPIYQDHNGASIWAKTLSDGALAVGLFNLAEMKMPVTLHWSDAKLHGSQILRDLWRQQTLGPCDDHITMDVERHGVVLLKIRPSASER